MIIPGVFGHVFVQLGEIKSALFVTHGDSLLVCTSQLLRVPWVDNDAAVKTLGSTCKLRQYQNAMALLLCRDVLVGDQVHSVAGRRYDASIGDGVERNELIKVDGLVEEVDGHEFNRAKLAVDPADKLVHYRPQILILLDILPARHSDLYQNDLANPLWVVTEEDLQRVQLLRHALDIVQAIDTNHKLDALELLLQHRNALLDLLLLQTLLELLRINTDRESTACNNLALELDSVGCRSKSPISISRMYILSLLSIHSQ